MGFVKNLVSKSNLPWCVIGDFNDMMFMDEKRGGGENILVIYWMGLLQQYMIVVYVI